MDIGPNFEGTRVIWKRNNFPKMESKILKRLRRCFGFEIESNMDSNESGRFLLTLLNLKHYTSTKINS
jgi:hypothetical protein